MFYQLAAKNGLLEEIKGAYETDARFAEMKERYKTELAEASEKFRQSKSAIVTCANRVVE